MPSLLGLLETPVVPNITSEAYAYKLFFVGKAGVGKTSLMQQLCDGYRSPASGASVAMVNSVLFWPCRLRNSELVLFRLQFWDADDYAVTRYQHVLPVSDGPLSSRHLSRADHPSFAFRHCVKRQTLPCSSFRPLTAPLSTTFPG